FGIFTGAGYATDIGRWNGSSWSSFGAGLNSTVLALAVRPGGTLVAGGFFMGSPPIEPNHIAWWNGSAWSSFGQGLNNTVYALAVLPNGDVVAGGDFSITARSIARWNGASWSDLGAG